LQRLKLSRAEEPGHLYQPGRSIPGETLDQLLTSRFPTQPPKGFQHRQIRFPRAILFDTLPAPDPQMLMVPDACDHLARSSEGRV
jgi:hypothetical protein